MTKSPRKIGVIVTGGAFWEIIFCFLHLENKGYLRLPITLSTDGDEQTRHIEAKLSRSPIVPIEEIKATGIDTLLFPAGKLSSILYVISKNPETHLKLTIFSRSW